MGADVTRYDGQRSVPRPWRPVRTASSTRASPTARSTSGAATVSGNQTAMEETFGSSCHGAGRLLSRKAALRSARGRRIASELRSRGIEVMAKDKRTLAEEMSEAYKDVADVVDVIHGAGVSRKVARLRPIGVIKG